MIHIENITINIQAPSAESSPTNALGDALMKVMAESLFAEQTEEELDSEVEVQPPTNPPRMNSLQQQAVPASVIAGAVFDFAGYLTTLPHKEAVHCSEAHEAVPLVKVITEWCKRRNLPTDGAKVETWRDHLAPGSHTTQA